MKTLESILQGVTPPETWNFSRDTGPNGKCYELAIGFRESPRLSPVAKINFPDKTDEANAALILRAARNFAPLVRALEYAEQILSATECSGEKQLGNGPALDKARKALAQALADEP